VQIPEVIDATAVPSHQQLKTFVSAMQKVPIEPSLATRQDIQEIAQSLREHKNPAKMWILVTPLAPAAVSDFYQSEAHRPGWEVVANTTGCCLLLRRGQYDMLVSFSPDNRAEEPKWFML
jgi:hypothetical protein